MKQPRHLLTIAAMLCALGCGSEEPDQNNNSMNTQSMADGGQDMPPAEDMARADMPAGEDMPTTNDMESPEDLGQDMPGDEDMAGDMAADMAVDMTRDMGAGGCPVATLSGALPITYDGSTIGKPNLAESNRLEWDDAGDDALLWVVPETGDYEFSLNMDLTTNAGCGVSIKNGEGDKRFFSSQDCPAEGMVQMLPDAYFVAGEGSPGTASLQANQELLIWVSCAYWSMPTKEVDYQLGITKQ